MGNGKGGNRDPQSEDDLEPVVKLIEICRSKFLYLIGATLVFFALLLNSAFTFHRYDTSFANNQQRKDDASETISKLTALGQDLSESLLRLGELAGRSADIDRRKKSAEELNRLTDHFTGLEQMIWTYNFDTQEYDYFIPPKGDAVPQQVPYIAKWGSIRRTEPSIVPDQEFRREEFPRIYSQYIKMEEEYKKNPQDFSFALESMREAMLTEQAFRRRRETLIRIVSRPIKDITSKELRLLPPEQKDEAERLLNQRVKWRAAYESLTTHLTKLRQRILDTSEENELRNTISTKIDGPFEVSGFSLPIANFLPFSPLILAGMYHWFLIYFQRLSAKTPKLIRRATQKVPWFPLYNDKYSRYTTIVTGSLPALLSALQILLSWLFFPSIIQSLQLELVYALAEGYSIIIAAACLTTLSIYAFLFCRLQRHML